MGILRAARHFSAFGRLLQPGTAAGGLASQKLNKRLHGEIPGSNVNMVMLI
jgi:hypothetical protein